MENQRRRAQFASDTEKQSKKDLFPPVAANVRTHVAFFSPDEATTPTAYRVPGTSALNPDWGIAVPETLVLRRIPDALSSRITWYQST